MNQPGKWEGATEPKPAPEWSKAVRIGAITGWAIFLCVYALIWLIDYLWEPVFGYGDLQSVRWALLWPAVFFVYPGMEELGTIFCPPIPFMIFGGLFGYVIKEKGKRSRKLFAVYTMIAILFFICTLLYVIAFFLIGYLMHF